MTSDFDHYLDEPDDQCPMCDEGSLFHQNLMESDGHYALVCDECHWTSWGFYCDECKERQPSS